MKRFLLGVLTTLLALAVAATVLLFSLGSGVAPPAASSAPGPSPSATPTPPRDLAADETWLASVRLESADLLSDGSRLTGVAATGSGVRFGPQGLRAERLDVTATLPFATVARQVGQGVRLYDAGRGLAGVERTATLLGRDVRVRATGRVRAEGGGLVLEPRTVELGGPEIVDSAASALARELVTIRQAVPGVPEGMVLREVRVTGAGFAVRLDGTDVVVGAGGR